MSFNLFPDIGLHRYTFTNQCIEAPDVTLNDRSKRIFICTKGKSEDKVPEDLQALIDYIEKGSISDDFTKRLDDAVQKAKSNREWEAEYVELCEKYWEYLMEGREEGRKEGREELLSALYKNGLSIEDISKYTGMSVETVKKALSAALMS